MQWLGRGDINATNDISGVSGDGIGVAVFGGDKSCEIIDSDDDDEEEHVVDEEMEKAWKRESKKCKSEMSDDEFHIYFDSQLRGVGEHPDLGLQLCCNSCQ